MAEDKPVKCPLCNSQEGVQKTPIPTWDFSNLYDCRCCGRFFISGDAEKYKLPESKSDRSKISAYVRWQQIRSSDRPLLVTSDELPALPASSTIPGAIPISIQGALDWFPRSLADRLDKALLNLHRLSQHPGSLIKLQPPDHPVCLAENHVAMKFTLEQFKQDGLIVDKTESGNDVSFRLSAKGWNRVAEIERGYGATRSRQAFVAMWINDDTNACWSEGIEKAVSDCLFDPKRIDFEQFNDKICDEVIAEIRRSRFVVADCSGHRHCVYFEAGFAKGLGLEVIWTCRESDKDKVPFDTRQYNHIFWKTTAELYDKLVLRIKATILSEQRTHEGERARPV